METRYRALFPDAPEKAFNIELLAKVPTYTLVYFVACLLGGAFAGIFCSLSAYFAQILNEETDQVETDVQEASGDVLNPNVGRVKHQSSFDDASAEGRNR